MPATAAPSPIAGVSPARETVLENVFPSVASHGLGRWIGSVMGQVGGLSPLPFRLLALVIVGAILAPLGALLYFVVKVTGTSFLVTNRSVQERSVLWGNLVTQVALTEIQGVEINTQEGYAFHRVGDVRLLGANGQTLLVIPAIQFPERLARVILEVRDAQLRSSEALRQIQSRK